ncbi:MAG: penicillin-binding transpeptidase domain-containing protein [Enterocloster clostridioformis]
MPAAYGSLMSAEEAAGLTELMRAVVTEGTGLAVRTDAYTVAAKTGSAEFETGRKPMPGSPDLRWLGGHRGWWCTVLVEEGGSGGKAAAPIARQLLISIWAVEPDFRQQLFLIPG